MLNAEEIYEILMFSYGVPRWWSDDPFTVMFQSVLVQNTAWGSWFLMVQNEIELLLENGANPNRKASAEIIPTGRMDSNPMEIRRFEMA